MGSSQASRSGCERVLRAAAHEACGHPSPTCPKPDIKGNNYRSKNERNRLLGAFRRWVELGCFLSQFSEGEKLAQLEGTVGKQRTPPGDSRINLGESVAEINGYGLWRVWLLVANERGNSSVRYECWLTVKPEHGKVFLLLARREDRLKGLKLAKLQGIAEYRLRQVCKPDTLNRA